ncbi:hypothetical protein [Chryseobacterium sp. WLY505]|uniref:hypothetical protein n=1 Tax=Chryseobacterium sp. WLY505 TaxID=3068892 RepID=UPI002796A3DD|nr:hypothetical protein [Chryseobacterium sp. WLY505]MDQ1859018.1 hypothetical protein [Chryseobacterium sp. WLY505]
MKAIDTRKTAETKILSDFNKQFDEVMGSIKHYAAAGKFQCEYYHKLDTELQEYLKELGYKVDYKKCGNNEYETVISW